MCGIAGVYNLNKQSVDKHLLKKMTDIIKHRGPDDEGFYYSDNIGLGHRRLSIIELSSAGHQPMSNENETIWIVFNGEIYNYIELRQELIDSGYNFSTKTDTEVIIKAYEKWGEECLKRFNGMFAFALWDGSKKKLLCARDRFGIKPFYYYFNGKIFLFSSEIKSLLLHPDVAKKPNEPIIYDYLALQAMDHTEDTFFEGIKQLSPSHYLILDSSGNIKIDSWYNISISDEFGDFSGKKDEEYAEQFLDSFSKAIRLHLRSDVPIGSCLSGGLDSSSIVCLTNKLAFGNSNIERAMISERQKTFTAAYKNENIDESDYAEEIVQQTGAEGNYVFPDGNMLWDELEKLVWHQEEPFPSTSIYAQWNVMRKAASRGIKVLLDGQGSDELLAGYYARYVPVWARMLFKKGHPFKMLAETKAFSDVLEIKPQKVIRSVLTDLVPENTTKLLKSLLSIKQYRIPFIHERLYEKYHNRSSPNPKYCSLGEYMYKIMDYSLKSLLRYEDRNSMAFSIEARVPFLDSEFAKFVFQLPLTQKMRNGWSKVILRNAMKGILPESIRLRRPKLGFDTPESAWLRQNRDKVTDIFASDSFLSKDYVSREWILSNLNSILSGTQLTTIWRWISLEMWMRVWGL